MERSYAPSREPEAGSGSVFSGGSAEEASGAVIAGGQYAIVADAISQVVSGVQPGDGASWRTVNATRRVSTAAANAHQYFEHVQSEWKPAHTLYHLSSPITHIMSLIVSTSRAAICGQSRERTTSGRARADAPRQPRPTTIAILPTAEPSCPSSTRVASISLPPILGRA